MMLNKVAHRYGKALYEVARASGATARVMEELRVLREVVLAHPEILSFLQSPLVASSQKLKALESALSGKVTNEIMQTLRVLADKNRLSILADLVEAFQFLNDEANGVVRGSVRSASSLSPQERSKIEATVEKVTKKKVVLTFEQDPALLGGMVAQVGGWTFDDSLKSHLTKLTDVLNRN